MDKLKDDSKGLKLWVFKILSVKSNSFSKFIFVVSNFIVSFASSFFVYVKFHSP